MERDLDGPDRDTVRRPDPSAGRRVHQPCHQRGSGRGGSYPARESERPRWQDLPSARRHEIVLTPDARADLRRLAKRDPKTHRQIQGPKGLFDALEQTPDLGYPLQGEWEGCFAVHVGNDRYRVIWELLPATEDYKGGPGDEVVPVAILRVGPKTDGTGRTIYNAPRSSSS